MLVNRRGDLMPTPVAIVQPTNAAEIEHTVQCAATVGVQVCASDGLHGWDNKAGCSGGIMIQCVNLLDFSVDHGSNQVTFGSGWWTGGLFYHLDRHGLFLPGGSVNSVGVTGFLLGCGRGHAMFMHGLSCDSVLSVEYVDSNGRLQVADKDTNTDMFWMANGAGGEFPGIVTKFRMQAYAAPDSVWERSCEFPSSAGKATVRKWLSKGPEMEDPARKLFSSLTIWDHGVLIFKVGCLGCSLEQQAWVNGVVDEIVASGHNESCTTTLRQSWLDQILYESGIDDGVVQPPTAEGLLDRTNGWGVKPNPQATVVSGRVAFDWELTDELWDAIAVHVFGNNLPPWTTYLGWYLIGGPMVNKIADGATSHGNRNATWSIHYKDHIAPSATAETIQTFKGRKSTFQAALDAAGLPCKNFYNYIDAGLSCASTREEWLEAYFSDVPRMKSIKRQVDPHNVIRTRNGCGGYSDVPPWQTPWACEAMPAQKVPPLPSMPREPPSQRKPPRKPPAPAAARSAPRPPPLAPDPLVWGGVMPRSLG